jgi:hypothetical protein
MSIVYTDHPFGWVAFYTAGGATVGFIHEETLVAENLVVQA